MTPNEITEMSVIELRNRLREALDQADELLRDIRNSDETPEGAAIRYAQILAGIQP